MFPPTHHVTDLPVRLWVFPGEDARNPAIGEPLDARFDSHGRHRALEATRRDNGEVLRRHPEAIEQISLRNTQRIRSEAFRFHRLEAGIFKDHLIPMTLLKPIGGGW